VLVGEQVAGEPGVSLAALEAIGLFGFFNFPELANNLGGSINPSTLRPRVQALVTAGMLETALRASLYRISQRGRVFLQLCNLISRQQVINAELAIILERLALDASREPIQAFEGLRETLGVDAPLHRRRWLGFEVVAARKDFGVPISGGPYPLDSTRQHRGAPDVWIGR